MVWNFSELFQSSLKSIASGSKPRVIVRWNFLPASVRRRPRDRSWVDAGPGAKPRRFFAGENPGFGESKIRRRSRRRPRRRRCRLFAGGFRHRIPPVKPAPSPAPAAPAFCRGFRIKIESRRRTAGVPANSPAQLSFAGGSAGAFEFCRRILRRQSFLPANLQALPGAFYDCDAPSELAEL